MTEDAPNADGIRQHYDVVADVYESVFFDDLSDARWLRELANSARPGALTLDVGCGPGHFASFLSGLGLRSAGVDLSMRMLRAGRDVRAVSVPLIQATMSQLPFRDAAFEAVLVAYSLLHVPRNSVRPVLIELRRVCSVGSPGLLLLREGDGEGMVASNLVHGETFFACFWQLDDLRPVLSEAHWRVVDFELDSPVKEEEVQLPKLAVKLVAS